MYVVHILRLCVFESRLTCRYSGLMLSKFKLFWLL